jgi:hypothetical protein
MLLTDTVAVSMERTLTRVESKLKASILMRRTYSGFRKPIRNFTNT